MRKSNPNLFNTSLNVGVVTILLSLGVFFPITVEADWHDLYRSIRHMTQVRKELAQAALETLLMSHVEYLAATDNGRVYQDVAEHAQMHKHFEYGPLITNHSPEGWGVRTVASFARAFARAAGPSRYERGIVVSYIPRSPVRALNLDRLSSPEAAPIRDYLGQKPGDLNDYFKTLFREFGVDVIFYGSHIFILNKDEFISTQNKEDALKEFRKQIEKPDRSAEDRQTIINHHGLDVYHKAREVLLGIKNSACQELFPQ